jgi:methylmalonyl-CoA mutase
VIKEIKIATHTESLSHSQIQNNYPYKIPKGDIFKMESTRKCSWRISSGLYSTLNRKGEDPSRMFAGEGGKNITNKRFMFQV